MKVFVAAAVAALVLGAAQGHAQVTAGSAATSGSTSGAMAGIVANVVVPGSGGAAAAAASSLGTFANPQWIMGQSTIGPAVTSYDACSRSRSGSILSIGAGWTQTDDDCARQRQAEFLRQMGAVAEAYEVMCGIKAVASADWNTGRMLCRNNQIERDRQTAAQAPPTPIVTASSAAPVAAPAYPTFGACLRAVGFQNVNQCQGLPQGN